MTSLIDRARVALLLLGLAACLGRDAAEPGLERSPNGLGLAVDRQDAKNADTVSVLLRYDATTRPMAAWQGVLRFDPTRLTFLGQPAHATHLVMLNDSLASTGAIRLLALDVKGLDTVFAELEFVVRGRAYTDSLRFEVEEAVTTAGLTIARPGIARGADELSGWSRATIVRRLDAAGWIAVLGYVEHGRGVAGFLPGTGTVYGDGTLNGVVSPADVVAAANLAVGNLSLFQVNRDYAIAINVAPINLPGLGEADDPNPPGRNPDGSYTITASDATLIANEAVGFNQPVVGDLIPGRTISANRVVIADPITVSRTFHRDTVYELHGTVIVGDTLVPDVTLTIESGTRIEGDRATRGALVFRRGANIDARGTRLLPIVFTCEDAAPEPGCWGGITLTGFGVLNNGDPDPDGTVVGLPTKQVPGCSMRYGGNLTGDDSGVMRYVRIEYAGKAAPGTGPLPGLSLLGVGSGTRLDSLQVYESLGDGIMVSGGAAQLRNVVVTESRGVGLRWNDGWQGKGQFLIVEQGILGGDAIRGANADAFPNAGPRSFPRLSNLTIVGPGAMGLAASAMQFRQGSAGIVQNALILRAARFGLDVNDAESCARMADSLDVRTSMFFDNAASGSDDDDCADEPGFLDAPARANRTADPLLLAPYNTPAPDFRPLGASPALTGSSPPPSDGFFDLTAQYLGAVAPATLITTNNIPWYAGWTRGR